MENKQKFWTFIGIGIILLAIAVLILGLYNRRVHYIAITGSPFFSISFLGLCLVTLVVHLLLPMAIKFLQKQAIPHITLFTLVASLAIWFILEAFLDGFKVYSGTYLLWLLLLNLGLVIILNSAKLPILKAEKAGRGILAVLSTILISLIFLELVLRAYFGLFGSVEDKIAYLYSVDEILAATNRYQGYPYINYGLSPTHPEHNIYGYRGAAFERPKPEGVFRIFTLGGSTTFGASLSPQDAYPAQLQLVLREDYGYTNVEVVNAGVSAYSSADSLANLAFHVLDDEPDMIIVYDNINDVRARLVRPEDYSGLNLQRGIWSPSEIGKKLSPFVLVRFIQVQLGFVSNPGLLETLISTNSIGVRCTFQLNEMCSELGIPAQDVLDSNPPIYFERNLRNMVAIARANNVTVVFATWAYYSDETPLDNILSQAYVRNAADEHNTILRALALELDIPLIDFASSLPLNASYWQDGMHMTVEGSREQAREFAVFLVENALLPDPQGE